MTVINKLLRIIPIYSPLHLEEINQEDNNNEDLLLWTSLPIATVINKLNSKNIYYTNCITYYRVLENEHSGYQKEKLIEYIKKNMMVKYDKIIVNYEQRLREMEEINKNRCVENKVFLNQIRNELEESYNNATLKLGETFIKDICINEMIITDENEKENYSIVKFAGSCKLHKEKEIDSKNIQGLCLITKCNNKNTITFKKLFLDGRNYYNLYPDIHLFKDSKLLLSMLMKNEADKFLQKVLKNAKKYIDEAVIVDDGSTDNSVRVASNALRNIDLTIVCNKNGLFNQEYKLRQFQWKTAISKSPDWIINLDADEQLEDRMKIEKKWMINHPYFEGYAFRLYDFWDECHYRNDTYWRAHNHYNLFMVKPRKEFENKLKWRETNQHCGRYPYNICQGMILLSSIRVKHFGWCTEEIRRNKYERYMKLDPEGKFGIMEQYKSILDENPNLEKWIE